MTALCIMCVLLVIILSLIICERAERPPRAAPTRTVQPIITARAGPEPTLETIAVREDAPVFVARISDAEITMAAQTVWGEARGIPSQMEQAAVVWCILNRVDKYGDSLEKIVTAPNQFAYGAENGTVDDYGRDLEELVRDVVDRWEREKNGEWPVGRVLPAGYLYFGGENGRNWFRPEYDSFDRVWDWPLPNPYES